MIAMIMIMLMMMTIKIIMGKKREITQDILFRLSFLGIIKYGTDLYMITYTITYMITYLQYWKSDCSTTFYIQTYGFL